MAERQKPQPKIVEVAAKAVKRPETVTLREIKSMGARILDDQKNDPVKHKPVAKPPARRAGSLIDSPISRFLPVNRPMNWPTAHPGRRKK
jgi:hypothetical protein